MFSLAGPCGWKLTGILRVHRLHSTLITEAEPIPIMEKSQAPFVSADTYLVIPEEVYRSVNPKGTSYGYLWVDCAKKDVASVEKSLNDLLSDTSHIKLNTYHAELQTAEYASRMMKLGCYLFMAIVGLIGFMESGKHHDHQVSPRTKQGIRCAASVRHDQ